MEIRRLFFVVVFFFYSLILYCEPKSISELHRLYFFLYFSKIKYNFIYTGETILNLCLKWEFY